MQLISRSPLSVGSLVWQSRPSMCVLTLAVRATFTLRPGESVLAADQEPVRETDEHWGDDPARSLRCPSDLVPLKPRAEVILAGHAHAPGGTPARSLVARLVVGEAEKAVEVFADRWFDANGALREGARFTRMPLIYERAAAGHEGSNPAGVAAKVDGYGRIVVPNLQPLGLQVSSPSDYVPPIGMGALAPTWPGRREKLGRGPLPGPGADGVWGPLATDLDPAFFNSAPRDQQLQTLREDERLVLENLHPAHPRLVTNLPGVKPRATVDRKGQLQDVFLRCDTLWIDSDRGLCTLTWRGQIALADPTEVLKIVVALDASTQPVIPSARAPLARVEDEVTEDGSRMIFAPDDAVSATISPGFGDSRDLPFAREVAALREEAKAKAAASGGLPFAAGGPSPPSSPASKAPLFNAPPLSGAPATPFNAPSPAYHAPPAFHAPPLVPASAPTFGAPPAPAFNAPPLAPQAPAFKAPPLGAPPGTPLGVLGASPLVETLSPAPVTPPSPAEALLSSSSSWSAVDPRPPAPVAPPPAEALLSSSSSWSAVDPRPPAPIAPASAEALLSGPGAWSAQDPRPQPMTVGQLGGLQNTQSSGSPVTPSPSPAAAPSPATSEAPRVISKLEPGRALQLVWFDPDCLPRVRRKPDLEGVFADMEQRLAEAEHEEPLIAKDPMAIEDRRDVFEALARGDALDEAGLQDVMNRAVQADGRFTSPFVLLSGEVRFPFDELETLRATLAVVAPFVGTDEALRGAVSDARDFLQTPGLVSPPGVTEGFTSRVVEAFRKVRRAVSPTYLEDQTERVLLEKRAYQRRELFGDSHVRALLQVGNPQPGASPPRPWPLYLPSAAARVLPMYARFQGRLLADGVLQEDQFEAHWGALRATALARVAVLPVKPDRPVKPGS